MNLLSVVVLKHSSDTFFLARKEGVLSYINDSVSAFAKE